MKKLISILKALPWYLIIHLAFFVTALGLAIYNLWIIDNDLEGLLWLILAAGISVEYRLNRIDQKLDGVKACLSMMIIDEFAEKIIEQTCKDAKEKMEKKDD